MRTDKQLYEIFEINPQWLFELIERPSPGRCRFTSITVKAIERHSDGVLLPEDVHQPVLVTEIQMQADRDIYNRVVIEMALIQKERAGRSVEGLIIFGSRELDVQTKPWCQVVSVYYLDQLLEQLARRWPNHPLVAVFQPLVEPDRELLESRAAAYYNQIKTNTLLPAQQKKLLAVFCNWLVQRFGERTLEEIEKMLMGELPQLQETQAGKDLIAIGIERGIEKGMEKGMEKGIAAGMQKGTLVGAILTCQDLLGLTPTDRHVLEAQSLDQLELLAENLRADVARRLGNR